MLDRIDSRTETTPPPDRPTAVPLRDFLARIGAVLSAGLPSEVWLEATVLSVRTSAYGHKLELVDPTPGPSTPQLAVFLLKATLADIRQRLGLPLDPGLLAGMSIVVLIAPRFDPRWHIGGRVVRLAGGVTDSIRHRMVEEIIATLRREKLFDAQSRLRRPADVTRVTVVHPAHAAGWDDIRAELARWEGVGLVCVRSISTAFEGADAAESIAKAIATASEPIAGTPPDLVLLVRGGGGRAGLLALDTEAVARAICRCPVPIITGLGHAGDTALADRVAWRRADTPSKAGAMIAEIIAIAARRAEDNRADIMRRALQASVGADHQLLLLRGTVARAGETALGRAGSQLQAHWAGLRMTATATLAGIDQHADRLRTVLTEQSQAAARTLDVTSRSLQRMRSDFIDRLWRGLSRADDGAAALAGIEASVRAQVERAAATTDQAIDAMRDRVARAIEAADTTLRQIALVLESRDLTATLARGFVLVFDPHGKLVSDRATALSQSRLVVQFHDGVMETKPVADA